MHEYEINDYFEEWYDDDMNEFRYGNRCAMMVYGQAVFGACFLIHLFRLASLFNVHPLWAFWCNGSTLWLSFKTIFTPGGMKEYSKPRYFYLGMWWSFFWYGRVVTPIIMKGHDVDRVHLRRVYAGILALENARRDCWANFHSIVLLLRIHIRFDIFHRAK